MRLHLIGDRDESAAAPPAKLKKSKGGRKQ